MECTTRTVGGQPRAPWIRWRDLSLTAGAFAVVLALVFGLLPQDGARGVGETHAMLSR